MPSSAAVETSHQYLLNYLAWGLPGPEACTVHWRLVVVDQVGFVSPPLFYHALGAARTAWVHVSHRLARSSRTAAPATCFEVVRDTLFIRYHPRTKCWGDLDILF